ncbi:hypothetical protein C3E99_03360 [Sphingopyxis sp. MG]|nr:hypothetical protein C3E99_03360 [Sphingopyxis sp. MG]
MGVSHQAIRRLGPSGFILRVSKRNLLAHQLDFPLKMLAVARRTTIGAEQRDGVDSVLSRADIAGQFSQEVFTDGERPRSSARLEIHLYRDEPALALTSVKVLRQIGDMILDVRSCFPRHLLFDSLDVGEMNELIVIGHKAGIGTYRLSGARFASDGQAVFFRYRTRLWSIPDQK